MSYLWPSLKPAVETISKPKSEQWQIFFWLGLCHYETSPKESDRDYISLSFAHNVFHVYVPGNVLQRSSAPFPRFNSCLTLAGEPCLSFSSLDHAYTLRLAPRVVWFLSYDCEYIYSSSPDQVSVSFLQWMNRVPGHGLPSGIILPPPWPLFSWYSLHHKSNLSAQSEAPIKPLTCQDVNYC